MKCCNFKRKSKDNEGGFLKQANITGLRYEVAGRSRGEQISRTTDRGLTELLVNLFFVFFLTIIYGDGSLMLTAQIT